MKYIICYDFGTTNIKCGIFDQTLTCLAVARTEYESISKSGGIVEVDPQRYQDAMWQCTQKSIQDAGITGKQIQSLCITTQGETMIPVDSCGNPLCNAIVWLDSRAVEEAEYLRERLDPDEFTSKTGLPEIDGFLPLCKLMYINNKMPEVMERVSYFCLLEDFIIFQLTGRFVTEKSLISSTGYYDILQDTLWTKALTLAEIQPCMIPPVMEPGDYIGNILPAVAEKFGFSDDLSVYAGAMDQVAGAVGCGNVQPGCVHETTGTALVVAKTVGRDEYHKLETHLTKYRHAVPNTFLVLSIERTAGAVMNWFTEQFCENKHYAEINRLVNHVPPGANGIMLLPYFDGMVGKDHSDLVRGQFVNIGLHNAKEDFLRAIMEGIAFMLKDNLESMERENGEIAQIISIGGASQSDVWNQMKADITGSMVTAAPGMEAALFGCASIVAVKMGLFRDLREASSSYSDYVSYNPEPERREVYKKLQKKWSVFMSALKAAYNDKEWRA